MKHKVLILAVLCLCFLPGTAFATNWVLAKDSSSLGWKMYEYIDADNVVQKDNLMYFWYEFKLVKPMGASQKIYKVEENMTTRQYRVLEQYFFVNGKPDKQYMNPTQFVSDSGIKTSVETAVKYVKEGTDIGPVPVPQ